MQKQIDYAIVYVMEKLPQSQDQPQEPISPELEKIEQKVQKFSDIYDENQHNGMDQTAMARRAGYSDFDSYADDAQLLFDVKQGRVSAEEALNSRNEKIEAARQARQKINTSTKKPRRGGNNRYGDSFKAGIPFGEQ